ncbi:hypothetical protein Pla123a_41040 [Posidoniimonas polymericola]|uniref:VWFA domain-containing protein n=1 Tax=Posidoniimonas polymericola TaxID=2528002 RepID=A0A5C5YES2_9BACT|nr:VWA domain-containing protein [Posidoniimonas polymericola]TWT72805.1 hypothetical protein Pla123a_41040 [Posidoniimonas polymericola]
MATPPDGAALRNRADLLHDTRVRLARLEIETHRLRAELARLEAHGEDEAAARLTEQLARQQGRIDHDRRLLDDAPAVVAAGISNPEAAPAAQPSGHTASDPAWDRSPAEFEVPPRGHHASQPPRGFSAKSPHGRHGRQRRRVKSEWAVSLAAHLALGAVLGLASFALPIQDPPFLLASVADSSDDYEDFVEISLDTLDPTESLVELEPLATEPVLTVEPDDMAPSLDAALTEAFSLQPAVAEALPADAIGLMSGGVGTAAGERGAGGPAGSGAGDAQFFGARSRGNRFVFVVDNSGSMTGGRMETTVFELLRSISAMTPKQEFHVLFYSDQVYPMFFPEPAPRLVPATRANRQKLEQWLMSVQMCKGDCLADAMDYAAELDPHVVYLLSDGGYLFNGSGVNRKPSRKLNRLTEETLDWPFTVHTLGMTVRSADSAEGLAMIANAHGGVFTPVGVLPAAAQLAKQQRIPYNRTPGPVWGSQVR